MARFGQGFLNALTQPSYMQGLFDLGKAAGSLPGRAREERNKNDAMAAATSAFSSESPSEILQAAQAVQEFDPALAEQLRNRALTLRQQRANLQPVTAPKPRDFSIEQKQMDNAVAKRKRLEQNVMGVIQRSNRGEEDKRRLMEGYLGASTEDLIKFLRTGGPSGAEIKSTRSGGQYIDVDNNIYEADIQRTGGGTNISYVPITPGAPERPVGRLTPVGGQFRETAAAATAREAGEAGARETAKTFGELRVNAAENIPELLNQQELLNQAVDSLDNIDTTGVPATIENEIRRLTGTQSPDAATYELAVGEAMYSRLKPLFGGVISEGERIAIEKLYNDLKRGNPANRAILKQLQKQVNDSIIKSNLIRNSANFEEYNTKLDKFFPEDTTEASVSQPKVTGKFNPETGEIEYYGSGN